MITLPQLLHIVNQLLVANYLTQANVHRLHKPEIINKGKIVLCKRKVFLLSTPLLKILKLNLKKFKIPV